MCIQDTCKDIQDMKNHQHRLNQLKNHPHPPIKIQSCKLDKNYGESFKLFYMQPKSISSNAHGHYTSSKVTLQMKMLVALVADEYAATHSFLLHRVEEVTYLSLFLYSNCQIFEIVSQKLANYFSIVFFIHSFKRY